MSDTATQAAALLLAARLSGPLMADLPVALRPADSVAGYAVQRRVAAALGPIGGWKVGASGAEALPTCAPMPARGIGASPSPPLLGGPAIEAEVAFRLGRHLPPRDAPYSREEIVAALATAHPAIEWLASAFADPDAVDPVSRLADLQVHGGFIWGEGRPDWQGIDFAREKVILESGAAIVRGTGNPAGDMVRLVQWLANEGAVWAGGLFAGQFVTCGSWTGKTPTPPGAAVRVSFASLGVARATPAHGSNGPSLATAAAAPGGFS